MLIAMPVSELHGALWRDVGRAGKIRARDKCNFDNASARALPKNLVPR